MKILFINHHGGGFAANIDIAEGMTIGELFRDKMPSEGPDDYLIRVNRQHAADDQVLHGGDRVSFTPCRIEGAAR